MRKLWVACLCAILLAGCAGSVAPVSSEDLMFPESSAVEDVDDGENSGVVDFPPEEEPLPPADTTRRITLVATGDLMVHTEQLVDAWDADTQSYDFSHVFAQVENDLREGDITIGNLETVFGGEEIGYSDFPRFNTPDSFAEAIAASGFTFVSTANNHCMDKDEPGLLRTLEVLDRLEIGHTGTFASAWKRDLICIQDANGLVVALLSYTFSTNGIPVPIGKEYLVNMLTEPLIFGDLARARALKPDLIAVLVHMGDEYEVQTNPVYARWMERIIYNGADIVLAHHPHVLQSMRMFPVVDIEERERTGFIIHSLGNFISSQQYEPRERSIILKLDVSKHGDRPAVIDRVRFVPTWVQFRDVNGNQLVRVLPVYDAIMSYKPEQGENPLLLRSWDIDKLYRINAEITGMYLGAATSQDDMMREYVFYEREEEESG